LSTSAPETDDVEDETADQEDTDAGEDGGDEGAQLALGGVRTIERFRDAKFVRIGDDGQLVAAKNGQRDLINVDPRVITVREGNPRDFSTIAADDEEEAWLHESIRASGVMQPLWVSWDNGAKVLYLEDGERRLRHVLRLIDEGVPIRTVPVIRVEAKDPAKRLLQKVTANMGRRLSQWEHGNAFRQLRAYGWTDEEIVAKSGFKARYVREAVELADAPERVKQMLAAEDIKPALALQTLRREGEGATETLELAAGKAKAEGKKTATTATVREPKPAPVAKSRADVADEIGAAAEAAVRAAVVNPHSQAAVIPRELVYNMAVALFGDKADVSVALKPEAA
jgi:hypothetical protein